MPLMFNTLLREAKVPLADVRLIRHKDHRADKGRTPYELWRDNRPLFESYQSSQSFANRKKLSARFWAVFIVNLNNETMFSGLYRVKYQGLWKHDSPMPHIEGRIEKAGSCDAYNLKLADTLSDLVGRLFIDWGTGALAWVQYAERNDKPVTELRTAFREDEFPGFMSFVEPLSRLGKLPATWTTALQSSGGVYLLTCPKTKEQYVGSASGAGGFWGRFQGYVKDGHGGNMVLKSREPSDYQVSILEVAGTAATTEDILQMETQWKAKLQSRAMGLNKN